MNLDPETRRELRWVVVLAGVVACICFGLALTVLKQAWTSRPGPNGLCLDPREACACVPSQGGPRLECREATP